MIGVGLHVVKADRTKLVLAGELLLILTLQPHYAAPLSHAADDAVE